MYVDPVPSSSATGFLRLFGTARASIFHTNTSSAVGILRLHARARPRVTGTKIATSAHGYLFLKGTAAGSVNAPYGSFRDFSHYPAAASDPAMVMVSTHNGGALSSDVTQLAGYQRYFVVATASADYPVSGTDKAWKRAAYIGLGIKFKGLLSAGSEFIDGAQFEVAKYAAPGPVLFQPARSLNCEIAPPLVNFAGNPGAIIASGTVSTSIGTMPRVAEYVQGSDSTAWQSEERIFIGINSVAIEWNNLEYPSYTTYPSMTLYPSGVSA